MPLIDPDYLSPTGTRVMPSSAPVPPDPVHLSPDRLMADIAAYERELAQLNKLVMLKIISEMTDTTDDSDGYAWS